MSLSSRHRAPPPNVRRAELCRLFMDRQPELTKAEARQQVVTQLGHDLAAWSAAELGRAVVLTFGEKWHLCIRTIDCVDMPALEVRARYAERRRQLDRERKKRERATVAAARASSKELDVREEALLEVIGDRPRPVSELIKDIVGGRAWRRPDGRPLEGQSLAVVVRRTLDRLKREDLIRDEVRPGLRGNVRWILGRNGNRTAKQRNTFASAH